MFLESVNHPVFLRMGLSAIDQALCGGIKHGGITEVRRVSFIVFCLVFYYQSAPVQKSDERFTLIH